MKILHRRIVTRLCIASLAFNVIAGLTGMFPAWLAFLNCIYLATATTANILLTRLDIRAAELAQIAKTRSLRP